MATTYHVSKTGVFGNPGTEERPFATIGEAARRAKAGDAVVVHEGEYREWVKPQEGGLSDTRRITYMAAEGERVVVKGSERIQSWEDEGDGVWKAVIPNAVFGDWNPYVEVVMGDWMYYPVGRLVHLGDVYLNGTSFYEAESLEAVKNPVERNEVVDNWTKETVPVKNPIQTKYLWFAEVDAVNTVIHANFHESDPNKELTEVNVRKCCFYPDKTGVDYVTVRGFEMAQAATPWAPPTGDQPGLIGAHWSKDWIIEDNVVHDAKCSAISIGKEYSTGDNFRTHRKDKPGYQYQLESVFAAAKSGWSRERTGSHVIRNNTVYDCGQNGVVGHLGCIFSEVYNNHIYNIGLKREFFGHEIAGIKLHAAIDAQIHNNRIHDCSLGIWLDWQAQGVRVSKNIFYNNNRDIFIEVSHGPCLVDHNIFTSKYAMDNYAQGTAFVHNIIGGKMVLKKIPNRATPYHAPHSTDVVGYAMVYGADDRLYQNIFVGGKTDETVGTADYDGCPTSLEEYVAAVEALEPGDVNIFECVEQPAYINDNAYLGGAQAFAREESKLERPDCDAELSLEEINDEVYLNITLPQGFETFTSAPHGTATLGRVRIVDAEYEDSDGSALVLNSDLMGATTTGKTVPGPLACLGAGKNRINLTELEL